MASTIEESKSMSKDDFSILFWSDDTTESSNSARNTRETERQQLEKRIYVDGRVPSNNNQWSGTEKRWTP
jgi:outer membrane protein assembly factor BamA